MSFLDAQFNRVLNVPTIGQDDDIARLNNDSTPGASFVREGVQMTYTPVIKSTGLVCHAVLAHDRIFAARKGKVGARVTRHTYVLGGFVKLVRM